MVKPGSSSSLTQELSTSLVRELARECGFDLAGVASARMQLDFGRFKSWSERGLAGEMRYLTDHRAALRATPESLLPGARSVICVGSIYNGPEPCSTEFSDPERAWIARYAWGEDYHEVLRRRLDALAARLLSYGEFRWRSAVDTAPLLERSLARDAGLGWIGKNTCLINQQRGSWLFLGELITTLDLIPDEAPPDRCGTCTRCIDACPTQAIAPSPEGRFEIDSRLCISYFTIELRGPIPAGNRAAQGNHIFGCDICQDVCPWNRQPVARRDPADPSWVAPQLERLAALSESEFRDRFRNTAVSRARYTGFLRNVAIAMGNSGLAKFEGPLRALADSDNPTVAEHADWALRQLNLQ